MKVAIVVAAPWIRGSIDLLEYAAVIGRLGHEPMVICCYSSVYTPQFPLIVVSPEKLHDPELYREHGVDVAILFSWLHGGAIVRAMKRASVRVVLRGDTDGFVSVRHFPAEAARRSIAAELGPLTVMRTAKHVAVRYISKYREEDADLIDALEAADAVIVEFEMAKANLAAVLKYYDRSAILAKVHVVTHFVDQVFLTMPVVQDRPRRVVANGRFGSTQKNAPRLARALSAYLQHDPATEVLLIGGGGEKVFAPLTRRFPQVRYLGMVAHDQMSQYMASARVFFSAARHESYPIAGLEAVALGCTIVATPIPGYQDITMGGRFGRLAKNHATHSLANALSLEMRAWDQGDRSPADIAAYWRPRLSSLDVVQSLLQAVGVG